MGIVTKKILLLSTGDVNGAYEAIYKLSSLFSNEGHIVSMLVKNKTKNDSFIKQYKYPEYAYKSLFTRVIDKIKYKFFNQVKDVNVTFDYKYNFISKNENRLNISANLVVKEIGFIPDIIISGMTNDFMNSTDLLEIQQYTGAQVYNVTVDMNHFTGGCHYAWDCNGYINGCNTNCPAIISETGRELAKNNFETKLNNAKKGNFKIISGSEWTLNQSKKSLIYKDQNLFININSLIDTKLMNGNNRAFAKSIFDLDVNKFYILMGCQNANDPRKGFEYLLESLKILERKLDKSLKSKIEVLIVSRQKSDDFSEIPFAKRHIDYIKDYRLLSLLYQASNIFVNSSIEDSGPMMVSEALACGTPVVGFDMGIVTNMVVNDFNGYKAILKDSDDLANGMYKIINLSENEYLMYSKNAIHQVEKFSSLEYAMKELSSIFK
jgi:glycosyltransferase involved in cell wall biosynthesis